MPDPDGLTQTIARHLEVDWQYTEHVEAWNTDRIAEVRAAGRRAGRLLGYRVVTSQSDPDARGDGRVVVVVVAVRESPTEEDRQRMSERSRLLLEQAFGHGPPAGESEK